MCTATSTGRMKEKKSPLNIRNLLSACCRKTIKVKEFLSSWSNTNLMNKSIAPKIIINELLPKCTRIGHVDNASGAKKSILGWNIDSLYRNNFIMNCIRGTASKHSHYLHLMHSAILRSFLLNWRKSLSFFSPSFGTRIYITKKKYVMQKFCEFALCGKRNECLLRDSVMLLMMMR